HPLLRCRFAFAQAGDGSLQVSEATNLLPRLVLVQNFRVLTNRDAILAALNAPDFDPRREVILETKPKPEPKGPFTGRATLVDVSTVHRTIHGNVSGRAFLLITDSYCRGGRVRALPGSRQVAYEVVPADYCLRAVPLGPGEHHLRVEYRPLGFVLGAIVS